MTVPPTPPWEGAHVLIVHFPVALLIIAPGLIFFAMFTRRRLPGFALAAWAVLLIGTVAAWFAVASGVAAFEATIMPNDAAQAVVEQHSAMGHNVRWIFTGLCLAYGAVLLVPVLFKRIKPGAFHVLGSLIVLAVYAWAAIYLANTAHLGGRLVHEFGVTAITANTATPPAPSAPKP